MTPEKIRQLYDADYAETYDEKFLHAALVRPDTEFEVSTLRQLLEPGGPWLDVACGTGYFLSQFPGVERAGLDLSKAMLGKAAARNHGVKFFNQSYLDPMPLWVDRWKLVSCMWYAYGLVSTMAEIRQWVENLATWTAPDGVCFVPICDPSLLSGVRLPYEVSGRLWDGQIVVTGITWSYVESGKSVHEHMFAPHMSHMLSLFKEHFEQIDLVTYPSTRQGLVARKKRAPMVGSRF